jgi:hypothetical protein
MKLNVVLLLFTLICGVPVSAHGQQTKTALPETAADVEKERTPQIERLYELVRSADRIVVIDDPKESSKPLFESSSSRDLLEFRNAFTLVVPDHWTLSLCAEPQISLYRDGKKIVTIGNVLGNAVRTSVWSGNAIIADPEKWLKWFDDRGMPQVRKERDDAETANSLYAKEEIRWYSTMPRGLKYAYDKQRYRNGIPGMYDLDEMNAVLKKEYPEKKDAIRALLHWYGSGSNSWSSGYEYETIAEKLLLQYETSEIVGVWDKHQGMQTEIEGTARLFFGWDYYKMRQKDLNKIPQELKKLLLDHALKSEDKDKIGMARATFKIQ